MTANSKVNRLIDEKSPYLLQHAYNPVNWFPWGEEAFEKAKKEGKPVFLSIGYSTCHWCHVMAHESFEDEEMAALLNERFVSIKVDREERPDLDSIYMKVCQMMTGHGGWPLSVFLTPDKIPFYSGTYFPKESKYGMPGFKEVITQLYRKFKEDPEHIAEVTDSVTNAFEKLKQKKAKERLTIDNTHKAYKQLGRMFDPEYGGFGAAPKFPSAHNLMFLMKYYHLTGKIPARQMVEKTLKSMADGGLFDHIGFGFTRYSTDEKWLVPHFEKMLYDQATLIMAYTEGYQLTESPRWKQISEQTIEFVLREMRNKEGAFLSAIDADSEGEEGKYYTWTEEEIFDVLGDDLGDRFSQVYNITPAGNFEGKNIPNQIGVNRKRIAANHKMTMEELQEEMEGARLKLLEEREQRVYPHVDDKILTSWNALMIAALARAGKVFERKQYIEAAQTAMEFAEKKLFADGRLMVRYRDGEVQNKGFLDDYAFLLWAYIELYEATFDLAYLQKGKDIVRDLFEYFWDDEEGAFYFSGYDSETLLTREKEVYDGAIPSGNSVAVVMLQKMAYLTGEIEWLDRVEEMYYSFKDDIEGASTGSTYFLQSLLLFETPTKEVVVIGNQGDEHRERLLSELNKAFLPDVSVLVGESPEEIGEVAPFAREYQQIEDKTTVYVCEHFACQQPTTNVDEALQSILS
ncbi:thioredoxin domain-containing protein [Salinibacillus aidingensis]|uniref:Thioredoxin domain-containing protein n=1 Tax=Salinibacillus aidingensis TaxID=237684 RepID=A0ABN1BQ85_9BACI